MIAVRSFKAALREGRHTTIIRTPATERVSKWRGFIIIPRNSLPRIGQNHELFIQLLPPPGKTLAAKVQAVEARHDIDRVLLPRPQRRPGAEDRPRGPRNRSEDAMNADDVTRALVRGMNIRTTLIVPNVSWGLV